MPETMDPVMRVLMRKETPTEEEWRKLILLRSESIRLLFDQITLQELGQVEFMQSDIQTALALTDFEKDIPNDRREPLSRRGIFRSRPLRENQHLIWGFTRKCRWIACKIGMESRDYKRHVVSLDTTEANDPEFLREAGNLPYYQMFMLLCSQLSEWTERRRRQYEILEELDTRMKAENAIIDALTLNYRR